jgi:hypothetical protein
LQEDDLPHETALLDLQFIVPSLQVTPCRPTLRQLITHIVQLALSLPNR